MGRNPMASILTERKAETRGQRPGLYSCKCKNAWGYRELAEASKG